MSTLQIDVVAKFAEFRDAFDQMSRKTEQAVGGMQKSFNGLNNALKTLGVGLSLAGLATFAKSSLDAVASLDDLSEKTSLTVETLSQLREVAIIGGHSLDDVAGGASKFAKSVSAAAGGNKEMLALFKQIGISANDLKSKKFDELFVTFATTIAGANDKTNALAVALKLAGKGASENLPFFNDLAERGLGVAKVFTEMSAGADKAQKNFRELALRSSEARDGLVAQFLPGLIRVSEEMKKAIENGDNMLIVMAKAASATFFGDAQLRREKQVFEYTEKSLELERDLRNVEQSKENLSGPLREKRINALKEQIKANDILLQQGVRELRNIERLTKEAEKTKPPGRTVGPVADQGGLDKAKRDAEAAAAAFADLAVAQGKIAAEVEKNLAKERLSVLERFYSSGLMGEANYWESRASIQQSAYDIERQALDQSVRTRQAEADNIAADKTRGVKSKDYADALKALGAAQAERNKLDQDFNSQNITGWLDKVKAAKDYDDAIKNVNIRLLEMSDKTAAAAAAQFDLQNERLARQVRETGSVADEQSYENLRRATVVQGEFNELREQATEVTERLALEEQRIQNSQKTGAISELTALQRSDAAKQNALATLRLTVIELDRVAQAARFEGTAGFEKLQLKADQARVAMETLKASSNSLAEKFNTVLSDSFSDAFGDFITGTKKASEAFKSFTNSVINQMSRMYAKQIATSLTGGAAEGGGAGGLIAEAFKALFGGGSGAAVTDSFRADMWSGSYAQGTNYVPKTGLALVHQGEKIIPAGESMGGGVTINNYNQIDSRSDRSEIVAMIERTSQRTLSQVADMTRRGGGYSKAVRG